MALTYTPPGELGSVCPDFQLPGVDGKIYARQDFSSSAALLVMFICNHCPYVKAIEDRLIALAHELIPQGLAVVGICANDPTDHPEDQPQRLAARWREKNYGFPYLIDGPQTTAKAFGAVCTPDFFLYDQNHRLVYRGRLDDSWKDPQKVQNQELKAAALALLQHKAPPQRQSPSMGCSIKWRGTC